MTKSNQFEKRKHIGIFELDTEEESVLTLFTLFKGCGYKVSLFLSPKIWDLIKNSINSNGIYLLTVFEEGSSFINIYESIKESINNSKIDLVVIPRFRSVSYSETKKYIEFFNEYKVLVGVAGYGRWLSLFPPLRFNGIKIIKRGAILGWLYCHLVFKHISAYFMSEIHRYSDNPLKEIIQRKTSKKVLDFPFKLMEGNYNPNIEYDFPVFVIPGKIEKKRRDYIKVLKCLSDPSIKKYKWKLILLGRPIGSYGKKVLEIVANINLLMGKNRVEYIKEYISKDKFDRFMNKSTHVLAPVTKAMYKLGKDSGALYDVFKYNKIGVFDDSYFYDDNLIEKKVILTFTNENDLKSLLFNIIMKKYSYGPISNYFQELSSYLNKRKYIDYTRSEIDSLLYDFMSS
jgi:hypothetical protein